MTTSKCFRWMIVLAVALSASVSWAAWQPHEVRQLNGKAQQIKLPAKFQIVTESFNRVVAVPYIIYMPEKNRLLMLVGCDYPHRAFILSSDDRGATWTDPYPARVDADGKPSISMGVSLTWLGNGKAFFYAGASNRWFTQDYGRTWGDPVPVARMPDGKTWHTWDPTLVDRDPKTGKIIQLAETGYDWFKPADSDSGGHRWRHQQGYIRFSTDEGKTWGEGIKVPQWTGVSEVALFRAANGDLFGACRTDIPRRMKGVTLDHFEGLGISFSKDDGRTWSTVEKLFDYGRHHPSMMLMPNQDIVMTYVVREGYVDDKNGFPQFGVEAMVSHDHGRTWDLDHKYILHTWSGNRKRTDPDYWKPGGQSTSSQLLPDGTIITAFGTGYRASPDPKRPYAPRDVGLVQWSVNTKPVNADRTIRDAPFDSELRNMIDPAP